jgi:hypothetical protein
MLKHTWRKSIVDLAAWNLDQIEEEWVNEFAELYEIDQELAEEDLHKTF